MRNKKPDKPEKDPQVYKESELELMIEMVKAGVWKNTNLAKTLNLNLETIAKWKKRKDVQRAYRQTVLKFVKKRQDPEKVLKELDFDIDPEVIDAKISGLVIIRSDGNKTVQMAD